MVQFISLRAILGSGSGFIAVVAVARMVPNCAQPIILAYGTCASAKISRHSARGCRDIAQNQRRRVRLTPYKIRSLNAVLRFTG